MEAKVWDVLQSKGNAVYAVDSGCSVLEAVDVMNDRRVGAALVLDGRDLVGILTERDVLQRVVGAGRQPSTTPVYQVMTRRLVTASPAMPVPDAMRLMTETRHRHLPVIEHDHLVGLVSIGDLLKCMTDEMEHQLGDMVAYVNGPCADTNRRWSIPPEAFTPPPSGPVASPRGSRRGA